MSEEEDKPEEDSDSGEVEVVEGKLQFDALIRKPWLRERESREMTMMPFHVDDMYGDWFLDYASS